MKDNATRCRSVNEHVGAAVIPLDEAKSRLIREIDESASHVSYPMCKIRNINNATDATPNTKNSVALAKNRMCAIMLMRRARCAGRTQPPSA
jgi:hypothetical protein